MTIEKIIDGDKTYKNGDIFGDFKVIKAGGVFWKDIPAEDRCIYHCSGSYFQNLTVEAVL